MERRKRWTFTREDGARWYPLNAGLLMRGFSWREGRRSMAALAA